MTLSGSQINSADLVLHCSQKKVCMYSSGQVLEEFESKHSNSFMLLIGLDILLSNVSVILCLLFIVLNETLTSSSAVNYFLAYAYFSQ